MITLARARVSRCLLPLVTSGNRKPQAIRGLLPVTAVTTAMCSYACVCAYLCFLSNTSNTVTSGGLPGPSRYRHEYSR